MVTTELNEQNCPLVLPPADSDARLSPLIQKHEMTLLMLVGFAGFSFLIGLGYNALRMSPLIEKQEMTLLMWGVFYFLIGLGYNALRRYVFKDFNNLDVVFDAGGRVSTSLTAVTVTSQLLWPADFLQSPTLASKVGVGGSLWYSLALVLSVLVFPVLCIQLKTRAPGAKTFTQIVNARFGRAAHLMFCAVALFTNMVIVANLILAGKAATEVLAKDYSNEQIVMILAVLFGSYCLVGGLGTTFYISYFNTALIFIASSFFILKFTYLAEPEVKEMTSPSSFYDALSCLKGPEGNSKESFLTFRTESGLIYAIVTMFMTIAIYFCDQANWQSRIAAKPKEGITGFFIAAFLWFAIPTSISFVNSLTYKALSFRNGTNLLTDAQIDEGYIAPFVIQSLLGREGCFMLLTLLAMTLMSTGSGEVMSVSSILIYDILKTYIRPFRPNLKPTDCPLCLKSRMPLSHDMMTFDSLCTCVSDADCEDCHKDKKLGLSGQPTYNLQYKCQLHGEYRHYEDQLMRYKTWCMVCIIILIVPFGLLVIGSGMNLNWAFMAAQVFISPFLVPLYMTSAWARSTSIGVISGGIVGLIAAVSGMFSYATTYEGGLSNFFVNTAQDWSILTGLLAGTITSTAVAMIVSLWTGICHGHDARTIKVKKSCFNTNIRESSEDESCPGGHNDISFFPKDDTVEEGVDTIAWLKTMSIDNPLNPYRTLYKEELDNIGAGRVITSKHMEKIFKNVRVMSMIGALVSFSVFLVLIPAIALSQEVLSENQLYLWITVCQHWCLIGTVFVVLVPPIQEGIQIYRQYRSNTMDIEDEKHSMLQ